MTQNTNNNNVANNAQNTAATKPAPMTRDEVKKMLRDAAFVLQMTRRVKAEILATPVGIAQDGKPQRRRRRRWPRSVMPASWDRDCSADFFNSEARPVATMAPVSARKHGYPPELCLELQKRRAAFRVIAIPG